MVAAALRSHLSAAIMLLSIEAICHVHDNGKNNDPHRYVHDDHIFLRIRILHDDKYFLSVLIFLPGISPSS